MDFIKPEREKKKRRKIQEEKEQSCSTPQRPTMKIAEPTHSEQAMFLNTPSTLAPKAAVLTTSFENESISITSNPSPSLPPTILSLFKPNYKTLSEDELHEECQRLFNEELSITPEESYFLFNSTKLQSKSLIWHQQRLGRLTASSFGAICKTSLEKPSKTVVNTILGKKSFTRTEAMTWGIEHENIALNAYKKQLESSHVSFEVDAGGLLVNPLAPHLGASADGYVSCSCCGLGVVEIKCPFSVRDSSPNNASFLDKIQNGHIRLSRKHNYYYQIQGQMLITERSYGDFVCWTNLGLYIERIEYDDDFVTKMVKALDKFFIEIILPKVLCGVDCHSREDLVNNDVHCFCRRGESGKMIACDSLQCKIGWFHYSCLKLKEDFEPVEWFCPQCQTDRTHL